MEISCKSCLTLFPELNVLVSQFKCGICYDFMKTPMITSCAHSYCSICIRTWITTKPLCPTCQSEVRDDSLRNNLSLENCIDPYVSLQNKLHELCKSGALPNSEHIDESTIPAKPVGSVLRQREGMNQTESKHIYPVTLKQSPKLSLTPEHNEGDARQEDKPQNVNSPAKIPGLFFPSPKLTNQQKPKPCVFTSPTSSSSASTSSQSNNSIKVSCPVCFVKVPEGNINAHLDRCLTVQDNAPALPSRSPKVQRREPLKKLVYHMMSDKEIKKKLNSFCLSTKGDRSQLLNRLQRYITLYNSECDSLNPRSVEDIRKQLEKDEEALTKVAAPTNKIFRISKNADPAEIEQVHKQYREENKLAYNDLIRQIRERDKKNEHAKGGPAKRGSSKDCHTSAASSTKKLGDDDSSVSSATPPPPLKRDRLSGDSDDFSDFKHTIKASKSRRIEDSDDELSMPRSCVHSQETPTRLESTKNKNSKGVLSRILPRKISNSRNSSDDDVRSPASPDLSRTSTSNKKTTKRRSSRKAAHTTAKSALDQLEEAEKESYAEGEDPNQRPSWGTLRFQDSGGRGGESSVIDFDEIFPPYEDDGKVKDMKYLKNSMAQLEKLMNESGDSSECTQEF